MKAETLLSFGIEADLFTIDMRNRITQVPVLKKQSGNRGVYRLGGVVLQDAQGNNIPWDFKAVKREGMEAELMRSL